MVANLHLTIISCQNVWDIFSTISILKQDISERTIILVVLLFPFGQQAWLKQLWYELLLIYWNLTIQLHYNNLLKYFRILYTVHKLHRLLTLRKNGYEQYYWDYMIIIIQVDIKHI